MAETLALVNLIDLVPPNLQSDPQIQAAASALDVELRSVSEAIPEALLLSRIDELPESVLDLLAWQFHVDFYEPVGFSIEKKRALIKQSIAWHRHKGTPWAVEQVLSAAFAQSEVREWFEYGGEPYRFKVRTTDSLPDDEAYQRLIRAIESVKNTRSWLDEESAGIEVKRGIDGTLNYGACARIGSIQTIAPRIVIPTTNLTVDFGQGLRKASKKTIGLRLPVVTTQAQHGTFARVAKFIKIAKREG